MMTRKETRFLKKLGKLYKKYNIVIDACGCCDSPFLVHLKHGGQVYQYIHHLIDTEIRPKKSFDLMASYIRKIPALPPVPHTPLKDINAEKLDSPQLILNTQRKLDRLNDLD